MGVGNSKDDCLKIETVQLGLTRKMDRLVLMLIQTIYLECSDKVYVKPLLSDQYPVVLIGVFPVPMRMQKYPFSPQLEVVGVNS